MPELDSLRGVAILLVLFFHGFSFKLGEGHLTGVPHLFVVTTGGGWMGVNLFFVLSGFLITGILLDSKSRPDFYKRFYIRRALRILPAYYALLILLLLISWMHLLHSRQVGLPFVALSFVYLSNVTALFGVPAQYAALWSLAVEEHFYLLWPTVVRNISARAVALSGLTVFLVCPTLRALAYHFGYAYGASYTWLVTDGLAIGAVLGALSRGRLSKRKAMRQFSTLCMAVGMAMLTLGAPFGIWFGRTFLGGVFRPTALNLFFAGVLGATLLLGSSHRKWLVRWAPLSFLGEISYGLYLIHMLMFDIVSDLSMHYFPKATASLSYHFGHMVLRFVVATALAVGVAFFSRKYFEQPFLDLKDRWTRSRGAPLQIAAA
jgi:peptidoglycan/LPS O-acetylase OafA/YrhL